MYNWEDDLLLDKIVLPSHSANPAKKRRTDMADALGRTFGVVADLIDAYLLNIEAEGTAYVTPADLKTMLDDILDDDEFDAMHDEVIGILEELKDFLRDQQDKPVRADITDGAFYLGRNSETKVRKIRVWRKYREYEGDELVIKPEGAKPISLVPISKGGYQLEFDAKKSPNQKHTLKGD